MPAKRRTQSSIAFSADRRRWFLINASPDLHRQIEHFKPLQPVEDVVRGTGISAILLTNGDLDHSLGLLLMREGETAVVHATPAIQNFVGKMAGFEAVLSQYSGLRWQEPPTKLAPLCDARGEPSGLDYAAFELPGQPPRYARRNEQFDSKGAVIGYRIIDRATGGCLICAPELAVLNERSLAELRGADLLLLDGTFWSDDELQQAGVGEKTAREMGHLPVGGESGSLAMLDRLQAKRIVYVHLNNTNPMLIEDSRERQAVDRGAATVGEDGMEFEL